MGKSFCKLLQALLAAALLGACATTSKQPVQSDAAPVLPSAELYKSLDAEAANQLMAELAYFYPRCVDTAHGGFAQSFSHDWTKLPNQKRSIVFQSRLTWVAAQAAIRKPELKNEFLPYARHGASYLRERMWDKERGGFFWELAEDGTLAPGQKVEKHAYGIAFAIYALSAAYRATGDQADRDLAAEAFKWLDAHGHDAINGGYYEAFAPDGKVAMRSEDLPNNIDAKTGKPSPCDSIGTLYGFKSMNAHIHIMEAFTELYSVWPDAQLKARLQELFDIVRDRICVEPGCMNLFFTPAWRPLPDGDSFGHDVETAFLLLETSKALGADASAEAKTSAAAKALVDHALRYGYDLANGGLYEKGSSFGSPTDKAKIWWTQAEWVNALLLMHELHGKGEPAYFDAFVKSWRFITERQIDNEYGGWLSRVEMDGTQPEPPSPKANAWKADYHTGRALLEISERLERLQGKNEATRP